MAMKVVLTKAYMLYLMYCWNLLFCGTATVAQQEVIAVQRNIFPCNHPEKSRAIQNSPLVPKSYLHHVMEQFKENI